MQVRGSSCKLGIGSSNLRFVASWAFVDLLVVEMLASRINGAIAEYGVGKRATLGILVNDTEKNEWRSR